MNLIMPSFCLGNLSTRKTTAILAVILLLLGGAAGASAATLCVTPGGGHHCEATISAAVQAANPGDTIEVAPGTYSGNIQIDKSLSLVAMTKVKPVIDATNEPNGIHIGEVLPTGGIGVSGVVVSGFEIKNAKYEGILVQNASDVTLVGNYVHDNDTALDISDSSCTGIDTSVETNEGFDCGEGIHLMGSRSVTVLDNDVAYNAGGILTSDETGPSEDNLIKGNHVHDNPYDCGITLASHKPASSVTPPAGGMAFGVMDNTIADNVSAHNGYQEPGSGAGVGIFAPGPGNINTGNVVIHNVLENNGQPGVAIHNHAAPGNPSYVPMHAPLPDLDNNKIIGNFFSGNGTDQFDGGKPTGINIYSMGPVWGTVVAQNSFEQEGIDTSFSLPAGEVSEHFNNFESNAIGVQNVPQTVNNVSVEGTVDATENWWGCTGGPGAPQCATASGDVMDMPWLTAEDLTPRNQQ